MKALEFNTIVNNNTILIPKNIQSELNIKKGKNIRVLIFIEDSEIYDEAVFKKTATNEFLKGYSESDSIYDQL
jgi:bifunctional DNA-binding transcriptional regulator/antitoxin component of YhaV-PrlF toxin-antitoxin module